MNTLQMLFLFEVDISASQISHFQQDADISMLLNSMFCIAESSKINCKSTYPIGDHLLATVVLRGCGCGRSRRALHSKDGLEEEDSSVLYTAEREPAQSELKLCSGATQSKVFEDNFQEKC